jgi:hypothetical protein
MIGWFVASKRSDLREDGTREASQDAAAASTEPTGGPDAHAVGHDMKETPHAK